MLEIDPDDIEQVKLLPGTPGAVEVTLDDGSKRVFSGAEAQQVLRLWAELFKGESPLD
jgi:hypothetical protein